MCLHFYIRKGLKERFKEGYNACPCGTVHSIQSILKTPNDPLKKCYGSSYYMTVSHQIKSGVTQH